jgi:hypothetical protein
LQPPHVDLAPGEDVPDRGAAPVEARATDSDDGRHHFWGASALTGRAHVTICFTTGTPDSTPRRAESMGISDWFKRLRARDDANAIERFEERRELEGDLPEGERFLADEGRVGRGVDEEIVKGELWGTLPTDHDDS